MTTHEELKANAAGYVLGSLDAEERRAFASHLAECEECAEEVASLRPVAGASLHARAACAQTIDGARPRDGEQPGRYRATASVIS